MDSPTQCGAQALLKSRTARDLVRHPIRLM
jgi:hypothetical protein